MAELPPGGSRITAGFGADLGSPLLQSPPSRQHLVTPLPPVDLTERLRALERRAALLEEALERLAGRVAVLEAPGRWRRRWDTVAAWGRRMWRGVRDGV